MMPTLTPFQEPLININILLARDTSMNALSIDEVLLENCQ